jgi:hypothetical protein
MRLTLVLFLFLGVIANSATARAKAPDFRDLKAPELERACHVLQAELGDCECTARFLEHRLGQDQGLLLLRVWAAGEGHLGDTSKAFASIYRDHDAVSVLQATREFFSVSSEFQIQCKPPGSMFADEEQVLVSTHRSSY